MKVYLTGVDSIKASKRNYKQGEAKKPKKKLNKFKDETEEIKEESGNEDEGHTTRRKKNKKSKKK